MPALLEQVEPLVRGWIRAAGGRRRSWIALEDLLQEALIRIHHGLPGLRAAEPAKFLCWARQVAANVARDETRRPRLPAPGTREEGPPDPAELAAPGLRPDEIAGRDEAIGGVRLRLNTLTDAHRRVLGLRAEGHDLDEVAVAMGLPSAKAAECLHRRALLCLQLALARGTEGRILIA